MHWFGRLNARKVVGPPTLSELQMVKDQSEHLLPLLSAYGLSIGGLAGCDF